jgi:hypothetical protein
MLTACAEAGMAVNDVAATTSAAAVAAKPFMEHSFGCEV